jgi:hypothetical protein
MGATSLSAVICGDHHAVQHRPHAMAIDPQAPRRFGPALFHLAVGMVEGDAAIAMGGAGTPGARTLVREFLRRLESACGLTEDVAGNR